MMGLELSSVRTLSNMNTSKTIRLIEIKIHPWDRGNGSISFEPDQIKTLISMATDSSYRL